MRHFALTMSSRKGRKSAQGRLIGWSIHCMHSNPLYVTLLPDKFIAFCPQWSAYQRVKQNARQTNSCDNNIILKHYLNNKWFRAWFILSPFALANAHIWGAVPIIQILKPHERISNLLYLQKNDHSIQDYFNTCLQHSDTSADRIVAR